MQILIVIVVVLLVFTFLCREKKLKNPSLSGPSPSFENSEAAASSADFSKIDRLLNKYSLVDKETEFYGPWREGRLDGVRIAFQSFPPQLAMYVGDFNSDEEQLSDLYMARVTENVALPNNSAQRLDPFLPENRKELALMYFLLATGPEEYLQLKKSEVCDGLLRLSDTVHEVSINESGGIELHLDCEKVTSSSLDSDLKLALRMYKALV